MIQVKLFENLGKAERSWLRATHHFSFGEYWDPDHVSLGPLRVWNDDLIRPGGGFPMHPHQDMEIITYVRSGAVTHEDSLGNKGVTRAGDIQVMRAGSGIVHSEYNHQDQDLTLFQIWIEPKTKGLEPGWRTVQFPRELRGGKLVPVVSGALQKTNGTLQIDCAATLYAGDLAAGETITHSLSPDRQAYLVPAEGDLEVNETRVPERSGAVITKETSLSITALTKAEVLLLDLPT